MLSIPALSRLTALWTVLGGIVDRFDDQTYPLLFPEMQITGGLENAVGVHRLGSLGHERALFKVRRPLQDANCPHLSPRGALCDCDVDCGITLQRAGDLIRSASFLRFVPAESI